MSFVAREVVVADREGEVVTALGSRYVDEPLGRHTGGASSLAQQGRPRRARPAARKRTASADDAGASTTGNAVG